MTEVTKIRWLSDRGYLHGFKLEGEKHGLSSTLMVRFPANLTAGETAWQLRQLANAIEVVGDFDGVRDEPQG